MSSGLYDMISILGALQGILLSLFFFARKPRHNAAFVLGVYLLVFSAGLLEERVYEGVNTADENVLLTLLVFSNFLYGPLLYLFVCFLTLKEPKFKSNHLLHFIPFVAGVAIDMSLTGGVSNNAVLEIILFEVVMVQLLTYNILAIRKLRLFESHIIQLYSNLETRHLRWLKSWLVLITSIYVLSFAITHGVLFGLTELSNSYVFVQLLIGVSIYAMSYKVIIDSGIFTFISRDEATMTQGVETDTYQKSGLKPEQAAQYEQQLLAFMNTQKPYLNPALTIYDLAEALGVSRNHLTEVINKRLGKNFYELVNEYRIEEVKQLMHNRSFAHLTISALGLEAGFRSKSAFNTNFKNITGLTPSQWKHREIRNQKKVQLNEVRS